MPVLRILDANFNRAREALRVMEDTARFALNRRDLAESIKTLRHDLSTAMQQVANLLEHRDTPGDVGTTINTAQETARGSIAEVAAAAGKRLSEAVRSLEEFSKTLAEPSTVMPANPPQTPPDDLPGTLHSGVRGTLPKTLSGAVLGPGSGAVPGAVPGALPGALPGVLEQIRYRGYEIERRLNAAMSPYRVRQWACCVLITRTLCKLPWRDVVDQSIDAGCDCIQVREKDGDADDTFAHASELVEYVNHRVTVMINDRVDIALACGAHGVHVGQHDLPVAAVRRLCGRRLIVGLSTHRLEQAQAGLSAGADYCGIGPMFPSRTKPRGFVAGSAYLRAYTDWGQLPHLAIGGISPQNIHGLLPHGVRGVAVSSAVCAADRPGQIVRRLVDAVSGNR